MTGKLKIIRVLANPIRKRKKKKKAPRRRRAKSAAGKYVLRMVTPEGKALWRTRTGWTAIRKGARTFATPQQGQDDFAAQRRDFLKRKMRWIVADVLPA